MPDLATALVRAHERRNGFVSPGALESYRRARDAGTLRDVLRFENSLVANVVPLPLARARSVEGFDGPRAA